MLSPNPKKALIIGASRGLGLALTEEYFNRGWNVVATERKPVNSILKSLEKKSQGMVTVEKLDVLDEKQIIALRHKLNKHEFDLLFINAGITNDPNEIAGKVSEHEFMQVMLTNALAPMRIIEHFSDLVPVGATIGVMSSLLGSVSKNDKGGWEIYRASKAALNTLMRSYAARNNSHTLLLMVPGWVRTDMGGQQAELSIEESIPRLVDVMLAQCDKVGLQYLDYQGKTIPW